MCVSNVLTEARSVPSQTSMTEVFAKIINGFNYLTNFPESSILDIWFGLWRNFCSRPTFSWKTCNAIVESWSLPFLLWNFIQLSIIYYLYQSLRRKISTLSSVVNSCTHSVWWTIFCVCVHFTDDKQLFVYFHYLNPLARYNQGCQVIEIYCFWSKQWPILYKFTQRSVFKSI